MSELTLDDTVAALLSSQTGEVVLRDRKGRKLGDFRPVIDQTQRHEKYRRLFTQEDFDKAEKALAEGGGLPLSEVWKQIKGEAMK